VNESLTIGVLARETGTSAKTIRFYESEGALPQARRTTSGYRIYGPGDVRRLRLLRNARTLGLSLAEAKIFVEQAFASDCSAFAPELAQRIATKRVEVRRRIAELRNLHTELVALEQHVTHAACVTTNGLRVSECNYCPMIDEEGKSRHEEDSCCAGNDRTACV
jgi:DNA-binding transcriptional MerR regulator